MKHYILTTVMILTLSFGERTFGQNNKAIITNYKIEINNWGLLLRGDAKWIVFNDSILFKQENRNGIVEIYSKKLSLAESRSIAIFLIKVNLNSINKNNLDNLAPDDMGEYDFQITKAKTTKTFHVYQVRIESVFNLVKQINEFLPDKYDIGYNDTYFKYKK